MNPVTVRLDHRAGVQVALVGEGVCRAIEARFTHRNPKLAQLARMGYRPPADEPEHYETFAYSDGWLTVPRGGLQRLREDLRKAGLTWVVSDERVRDCTATWAHEYAIPDHAVDRSRPELQLRPYQRAMLDAAYQRQNCLLRAATGCLTGSTVVTINRAGKGHAMRLDHVVRAFNGGRVSGHVWRPDIPTMVRAPFLADGTVRLAQVTAARFSGVQPVYRLRLADGPGDADQRHPRRTGPWEVVGTADHRMRTPFGWVPLCELVPGSDYVMVDGGIRRNAEKKTKPWYRLRVCRQHPHAGRRGCAGNRGWTVPEHRLVAEARLNGVTLAEFIRAVEASRPGLQFLDPEEFAVHHVDGNPFNNSAVNLEVLTHEEHMHEHVPAFSKHLEARLLPRMVEEIEYMGEEATYDLSVEDASAFVANGVAVHNSGKTTVGLALVAKLKVPTLVMVWTGGLLDQWRTRCAKELGLEGDMVGIVGDGEYRLRPVTLAMQQSVARIMESGGERADEMSRGFGAVIYDEVQRAPAATSMAAIDPFAAKWRVGISASERRKDQKEFLTYDLFGPVAYEVTLREVADAGATHDVEVLVVPTDHRAPWFRYKKDFNRLLEGMREDADRNAMALAWARRFVDEGEQVLLTSHRVEHCRMLDRELTMAGVRTGVLLGGAENAETWATSVEGMLSGSYRAAVGTVQAVGTGIDLPGLSRLVVATPVAANEQQWHQLRGRACRTSEGKRDAKAVYLWDRYVFGLQPVKNLVRWNRHVSVLDDGEWVDGGAYLRGKRATGG